jgi:hypothetical protein
VIMPLSLVGDETAANFNDDAAGLLYDGLGQDKRMNGSSPKNPSYCRISFANPTYKSAVAV